MTFGQPARGGGGRGGAGGRGATMGGGARMGAGAFAMNSDMGPSYEVDDRVLCKYCGRKFNEVAAERHIPHC